VRERRLVALAPPVLFLVTRLVVSTSAGHALARIFFTMWLHELGHAVTAWLCGYAAFPSLWFTPIAAERSPLVVIVFAGALGFGAFRLWRAERRGWAVLLASGLVVQLTLSVGLKAASAQALITFGGDAGCFVFGGLLMASVFTGPDSRLARSGLRWGLFVIGAFAFNDALTTWWSARSDVDAIPFGEIEGVGLSDPSKLVDAYGWTVRQLIHRYLAVATLMGAALVTASLARWRVQPP
jgi:hypothetical protein